MKRFLQPVLLVFLVSGSLVLPSALKRLTHSFHANRLRAVLPSIQSSNKFHRTSLETVRGYLSQDYYYLSRGSQAFVFVSADHRVVLKLFIFDSTDSFCHRFFHSFLRKSRDASFSNRMENRAIRTLEACKLADRYLPNETAIVYAHLNPGSGNLPLVHLIGPAWKRLDIQLDAVRFVLQKRADSLSETLMQAYLQHDQNRFFYLINQFNAMLDRRIACGIANTDPTLFDNFGVIGSQPVEIDFGNYIYCSELAIINRAREEKARYTDQLLKWVEWNIPQWKDGVVLRLKEKR